MRGRTALPSKVGSCPCSRTWRDARRSEEHTSELQSDATRFRSTHKVFRAGLLVQAHEVCGVELLCLPKWDRVLVAELGGMPVDRKSTRLNSSPTRPASDLLIKYFAPAFLYKPMRYAGSNCSAFQSGIVSL